MNDKLNNSALSAEDFQFKLLMVLFIVTIGVFLLRPPMVSFFHHVFGGEAKRIEQYTSQPQKSAQALKAYQNLQGPQNFPNNWQKSINIATNMASLSDEVFDLLNAERTAAGMQILGRDPQLDVIAYRHSKDMYERKYFDHISPDGHGPGYRVAMQHRRFFGLTRENVAMIVNTSMDYSYLAKQFNSNLMNSPGHRKNILHKPANIGGVGCYEGPGDKGLVVRHCTQLIAELVANMSKDVSYEYSQNTKLSMIISNISHGGDHKLSLNQRVSGLSFSDADIQSSGSAYQVDFEVKGPADSYQIVLKLQDTNNKLRYAVYPGPIISKLN